MILLQVQEASQLMSEAAQIGIGFSMLVVMVLVLSWVVVKQYKESKAKSEAHGIAMNLKDQKIEELLEARRQDSIDTINFVRDLQEDMKRLVESINKLL